MTKVKNAPNTKDMKPQDYTDYSSWIDYWESRKKNLRMHLLSQYSPNKFKCSKCGREFLWSEFVGAHVQKVPLQHHSPSELYIYPLCNRCNSGKDETPFEAIDQLILPMPQEKK